MRNISINQRVLLALKLDEIVKAKAKESYNNNVGRPSKNKSLVPVPTNKIHTDKELSKIAGVR